MSPDHNSTEFKPFYEAPSLRANQNSFFGCQPGLNLDSTMLTQALLIALAASADAAYLRASESRRLAGHSGDHDDNGSLGGCTNDPDWCARGVLNRALSTRRRR